MNLDQNEFSGLYSRLMEAGYKLLQRRDISSEQKTARLQYVVATLETHHRQLKTTKMSDPEKWIITEKIFADCTKVLKKKAERLEIQINNN